MKLDFNTLRQIACGAACAAEENGGVSFSRLTPEQDALYKTTRGGYFYNKTFSPAGVKLSFRTDSKRLFIKLRASLSAMRSYFSLDVIADGKPVGYIDNFSDAPEGCVFTAHQFPYGEFSGEFDLEDGEKHVCIHLPWSVKTEILEFSLEDGASLVPVKPEKKLLVFGDSISFGYDALRPSNRYSARIAELMDAEEFNKAMGGERFFPEIAELKDDISPEYIIVAYGTNNWSSTQLGDMQRDSRAFFKNISAAYPNAKIFAITPIWRKDEHETRDFGPFDTVAPNIRAAAEGIPNLHVICGYDLVPHDESLYADLRLHPNDAGFAHYTQNLYDKIKKHL